MKPSRRTIITLNRFTTFIQSWRGKTAGVLLCFLILLFLSCKDDSLFIGFPKAPRLNTHYIDLPLYPKVVFYDGVLTRNSVSDRITRILVGRYNDPQFGNIEARGYSNIAPPPSFIAPSSTATFDSLVLQLKMDYYYYGSTTDSAEQTIQVFEVLDTIKSNVGYYSNSQATISIQPLGQGTVFVDPATFDNALVVNADADTSNDQHLRIRIKLSDILGSQLLADMMSNTTLMGDPVAFMGKYKGLAFVMSAGDKIIGLSPRYTGTYPTSRDTKMTMYYTDNGVPSSQDFVFYFVNSFTYSITFPAVSFSTITTDRSGTALNGVEGFKDFIPLDNRFYVQSGTALITKLDLKDFYNYVDTIDNMIFNSAEVVLTNVSQEKPPINVQLRLIDSANRFRNRYVDTLINELVTQIVDPYLRAMPTATTALTDPASLSTVDVRADQGPIIPVAPDTYQIGGIFITDFIQQIYRHKHDPKRIKTLGLMPIEGEFEKSVSGLVLDPVISLRLYYSKPIIKIR